MTGQYLLQSHRAAFPYTQLKRQVPVADAPFLPNLLAVQPNAALVDEPAPRAPGSYKARVDQEINRLECRPGR